MIVVALVPRHNSDIKRQPLHCIHSAPLARAEASLFRHGTVLQPAKGND